MSSAFRSESIEVVPEFFCQPFEASSLFVSVLPSQHRQKSEIPHGLGQPLALELLL